MDVTKVSDKSWVKILGAGCNLQVIKIVKYPTNRLWKQHNRSQEQTQAVKIKLTSRLLLLSHTCPRAPSRHQSRARERFPVQGYQLNICCFACNEIQWNSNRLNWQFFHTYLHYIHATPFGFSRRHSKYVGAAPDDARREIRLEETDGRRADALTTHIPTSFSSSLSRNAKVEQ